MQPASPAQDEGISLFAVGTVLLHYRRRVLLFTLLGGFLAGLSVVSKPRLYRATASVAPQGGDQATSGLASIAGQFGVSLPTSGNQSLSPDFYAKLLSSRVLLLPIARDTFTVIELNHRRAAIADLYEIEGPPERREEQSLKLLAGLITPSVIKNVGVVEINVVTEWRSLSLAIANALVKGLNEYNERIRKGQAAAEREFIETRLELASADLRRSEERMANFLRTNRQLGGSPELNLERDRIQRDLGLKQQVVTSMMQAYEDARIREVRDIPVLSVFEEPWAPLDAQPRGRLKRVLFGLVLGAIVGIVLSLLAAVTARPVDPATPSGVFIMTLRDALRGMVPRRMRRAS